MMKKAKQHKSVRIHFFSVIIIALIAGIYFFGNTNNYKPTFATQNNTPIYRLNSKGVALECVVSWDASSLDSIIELAKSKDIGITFFVSNAWATKNSDKILKIYENEKNELAILGVAQDEAAFVEELKTAKMLNINSNLYMPYYDQDASKICTIASKHNYLTVVSTIDVQNKVSGESAVVARIVNDSFDGAIVRFEPTQTVAKALPQAIAALGEKNMNIESITQHMKNNKNQK